MSEQYDAIVVGGGFYGLRIALFLRAELGLGSVLVLESGSEVMNRASYVNQARVHRGYHYPRSLLTGYRSQVNFPGFAEEFRDAVVGGFPHYYAIARQLSKTNARQFELFCKRIGAGAAAASASIQAAFDQRRIERVFLVEEPSFDSRILREVLLGRIRAAGGIEIRVDSEVDRIGSAGDEVEVEVGGRTLRAGRVISAVYARLNALHAASGLPLIGLQHELTELALVSMPAVLDDAAFTVMDGPFFSMMPFPSRGLHSLSHVRYTVHHRWRETVDGKVKDPYAAVSGAERRSRFPSMQADVTRYLPAARHMTHRDSLFEAKTVMTRSGSDDSRPILYRPDHGIRGYTCILGGKLDNISDVLTEMRRNHVA